MAIANNQTLTNQEELSIQISLSGLSFCTLNRNTNSVTHLKHISFNKKQNPIELLDQLKHTFNTILFLQNSFNSVQVIHKNDLSTFVPKALFNEETITDYLKFNSKILKSDYITHDDLATIDAVNVYVPYVNINNYIFERFGAFTYQHFSTVLVSEILKHEKNNSSETLYIHLSDSSVEVIIIKGGKLIFYNSFEYATKEDFIYYILFALEQLDLNPETINTILLGNISENDEFYTIIYKYIRHVNFGSRHDNYNYLDKAATNYSDYALIKSFQCV